MDSGQTGGTQPCNVSGAAMLGALRAGTGSMDHDPPLVFDLDADPAESTVSTFMYKQRRCPSRAEQQQ